MRQGGSRGDRTRRLSQVQKGSDLMILIRKNGIPHDLGGFVPGKVHGFFREYFKRNRWLGILIGAFLFHHPAMATTQYVLCPFVVSGVDVEEVEVFRLLLSHEIIDAGGRAVVRESCNEASENWSLYDLRGQKAVEKSVSSQEYFVEGSVSKFGSKIVNIMGVRSPDGQEDSYRLIVSGANEFDVAARRFALAFLGQMDLHSPELGLITQVEVPTELRRETLGGRFLQIGGMNPINSKSGPGSMVSIGTWFEARRFVIETSVGGGWSSDRSSDNSYKQVYMKLGALNVLGDGNIAGIAGGGVGLFLTHEKYKEMVTEGGELIKSSYSRYRSGNTLAPGFHARVGALLFRTYNVRLFVNLDYAYSFLKNKWEDSPQSVGFSAGAIW